MLTFLAIILCSLQLSKASLGCGDIKLSSPTSYMCDHPGIFTKSNLPQMPAEGKDIVVQAEIQMTSACGRSPPYHFLTLSIETSAGTEVQLMDVQWDGATKFAFTSQDSSTIQTAYEVVLDESQPAGQWFSFTAWVKLGTNEASALFAYYGTQTSETTGTVSYPPNWTIDKSPKIFLCSNFNGADSIACKMKSFKVWYQVATNLVHMRDGTTPKLIARYNLNQYTGYQINDTAPNPLGSGYFGSSTSSLADTVSSHMPSWVPEEDPVSNKLMEYTGIVFSSTTQYATLPTFPIAKSLMNPAYSFTIKLWIKLSTTAGATNYIFRYCDSGLGTDIIALQISNLRLKLVFYGSTILADDLLLPDWNSVAVTLTSLYSTTGSSTSSFYYYYSWLINNSPQTQFPNPYTRPIRYVHDASNVVRLGGPPTFLGTIAGVEIYSPGSDLMTAPTSCQPSTCLRDLGVTSPSTCLLPICAPNCATCFNSQENGCLACNPGYGLYQSKCISLMCKPGKYLDGSNVCQNCIAHCESCIDSVSCGTCNSGFINQGTSCVCPSNSILDTATNTCQACIANCASCSDSISCDTCNPGFVVPLCNCPSGSVFDSGTNTCINLPVDNGNLCNSPLNFYYPAENYCKSTCDYPFKIVSASPLRHCILQIDKEDASQAQKVAQVSTIASYATNVGGVLIALLSYNNIGLLLIGSLTEMLSYIQYLKIDYPPKVYLMLYEQNINSGGLYIITDIPDEVADAIPNRPLPEEFAKNDTYSSFVANSWEFLISLSITLLSIGAISLLMLCLKSQSHRKLHSFFSKLLLSLRWNLFFGIFCSGYGFTGIFTALEFRTVNMDAVLSIFSFVVSLVINTLGFWVLYFIVHLGLTFRSVAKTVKDPQERIKQIVESEETWKSYQVIFEDYKNDHLSQKMFLFIFMFRTYIHYSILGYLNEYPFLQVCCFTVISISILLYLIIRRPMKSRMNYIQQIVCEVAIFIVNICVVILSSMDKWTLGDSDTRVRVGDVIIATNFCLSIAGSAFLIIETLSQLKDSYLFIKSWLQSQKNTNRQLKIKIRDLKKPSNTFKPKSDLDTESAVKGLKELEISDLDKSHDLSVYPLQHL